MFSGAFIYSGPESATDCKLFRKKRTFSTKNMQPFFTNREIFMVIRIYEIQREYFFPFLYVFYALDIMV